MINYQITIGYRAVITVDVQAKTEEDARITALKEFTKNKEKMFKSQEIDLQDDDFNTDGCLNLDRTWNMYNNEIK